MIFVLVTRFHVYLPWVNAFMKEMVLVGAFSLIVKTSRRLVCSSTFRPDVDIPELSHGPNPRVPSASLAVDVQYSPDRGRYFAATQELLPGMDNKVPYNQFMYTQNILIPPR